MSDKTLFSCFSHGTLHSPQIERKFIHIDWNKHPTFDGVELKHLITAEQSNGLFSYHLVYIAPNKKIGNHIHEKQLETHEVIAGYGICINDGITIDYRSGMISLFPAGIKHEIIAGTEGLYLFAKFFPALC